MRLVVIESPFAGDVAKNIAYARACMRHCLSLGEAPIVSHLLYTQAWVLNDEVPRERAQGIEAGLAWARRADATIVYDDFGISDGMRLGIDDAKRCGRNIEYCRLPSELMGSPFLGAPQREPTWETRIKISHGVRMSWRKRKQRAK